MNSLLVFDENAPCLCEGVSVAQTGRFSVISVSNHGSIDVLSLLEERVKYLEAKYQPEDLCKFGDIVQQRINFFEIKHKNLLKNPSEAEKRVWSEINQLGLSNTCSLLRTSDNYYEKPLKDRAIEVFATNYDPTYLCKSLLLKYESSAKATKLCLVIVQYIEQIDEEKLKILLKAKTLSFVDAQETARITGFDFNAVAPCGFTDKDTNVKILVSNSVMNLMPQEIYLGGGEVHTKLHVRNIHRFVESMEAMVGDFSIART